MPGFDGGPQEDPDWQEAVEPPAPVVQKFDFEQIDVKLYLAMKEVLFFAKNMADKLGYDPVQSEFLRADLAMQEFELDKGPLPDWAIDRNWFRELILGAQLCTKDGRRMGNAHLLDITGDIYVCLTDAGSVFRLNESEVNNAFWIGEWRSDPERIIKDFDRYGHFAEK